MASEIPRVPKKAQRSPVRKEAPKSVDSSSINNQLHDFLPQMSRTQKIKWATLLIQSGEMEQARSILSEFDSGMDVTRAFLQLGDKKQAQLVVLKDLKHKEMCELADVDKLLEVGISEDQLENLPNKNAGYFGLIACICLRRDEPKQARAFLDQANALYDRDVQSMLTYEEEDEPTYERGVAERIGALLCVVRAQELAGKIEEAQALVGRIFSALPMESLGKLEEATLHAFLEYFVDLTGWDPNYMSQDMGLPACEIPCSAFVQEKILDACQSIPEQEDRFRFLLQCIRVSPVLRVKAFELLNTEEDRGSDEFPMIETTYHVLHGDTDAVDQTKEKMDDISSIMHLEMLTGQIEEALESFRLIEGQDAAVPEELAQMYARYLIKQGNLDAALATVAFENMEDETLSTLAIEQLRQNELEGARASEDRIRAETYQIDTLLGWVESLIAPEKTH